MDLIIAENVLQLLWRYRLVRTVPDPGLSNMAQSGLLETGEKTAKTARSPAPAGAIEYVHQHTRDPGLCRPGARCLLRRQYLAQNLIK